MSAPVQSMIMNLRDSRSDPADLTWTLPPWGHPMSMMVFPLFITSDERLIPIGSAFKVGRQVTFVMSAMHNIAEALKHEGRFDKALSTGKLPVSAKLEKVGLWVLHQQAIDNGQMRFNLLPLENVECAPPTDIVIGYPQFCEGLATVSMPMSFELPEQGSTVWSVGYTDFEFPDGGLPMEAVRDGSFDWAHDYGHRLQVVEGQVEAVFVQRFARGYVDGPCFAFSGEISHGQSGGPVLSEKGLVIGVNSAGASSFFGRPTSLGSLLYPMLLNQVRYGLSLGPVRINASYPMIDLVARDVIGTDGSEEGLSFQDPSGDGRLTIGPRAPLSFKHVHDDFSGYRDGLRATRLQAPFYTLKRNPG